MMRITRQLAYVSSWGLEIGGFIEYFSSLCEEALEVACFGPYDGSFTTL